MFVGINLANSAQVSDEPQRATAAQVAHVENEIEVRAANIVSKETFSSCRICIPFHPFNRCVHLRPSLNWSQI